MKNIEALILGFSFPEQRHTKTWDVISALPSISTGQSGKGSSCPPLDDRALNPRVWLGGLSVNKARSTH